MTKKHSSTEKIIKTSYKFKPGQIWNADYTMAEFIYQLLKRYQKMPRDTYPVAEGINSPEEWEKLLKRFIKTFKRILNDYNDSPMNKAYDKLLKKHPKALKTQNIKRADGFYETKYKHKNLIDKYINDDVKQADQRYYEEISESLQLFAKYFLNIWC